MRRRDRRLLRRPRRQRSGGSPTSVSRRSRDGRVAALFALFAQNDAGVRVHVMYLMTYRTSQRLIDVVVFRGIFGNNPETRGKAVETLTAL
jgi:hypothetical protein